MKPHHVPALILAAILSVALFNSWTLSKIEKKAATPPVTTSNTYVMVPDHTTTWKSARGTEVVNTVCDAGEGARACLDRHNEKVTLAQDDNPQVP